MNKHVEEKKSKHFIHGENIKTVLSLAYGHQKGILHNFIFFQNLNKTLYILQQKDIKKLM